MTLRMGPSGGVAGSTPIDTSSAQPLLVNSVWINWGDAIGALGMTWSNGAQIRIGGDNVEANNASIDLSPLRRIVRISGTVGWWKSYQVVTGVQFDLSDGFSTGLLGNAGATPFVYDVPPGYVLTGFFGAAGAVLDQVGFIFDAIP